MKLSHSKLTCILECPMTYKLKYIEHISAKNKSTALGIGSAVHWGIEHNTENLDEFFKSSDSFKQRDNYTKEQLLSEAMVHGYMKHKDELFDKLLTDPKTGEKLELMDEQHEFSVSAKLGKHEFVGIVDLLLLTRKGFIIVDYKTSSMVPDFDTYLDQLYRYIYLLESKYPDIPVIKIAIINIRKTMIRQKVKENEEEFFNRMKFEYELNDENYINYHEFAASDLNEKHIKEYIENLELMANAAQEIEDKKNFYINYGAAKNQYGKSEYYDIFYHTPDCYLLYEIQDKIWDEDLGEYITKRDCLPVDMEVLNNEYVINTYEKFLKILKNKPDDMDIETFKPNFFHFFKTDEQLIELYIKTAKHEKLC